MSGLPGEESIPSPTSLLSTMIRIELLRTFGSNNVSMLTSGEGDLGLVLVEFIKARR